MKLFDYLNKYLNEGLNIDILDDENPQNRILYFILGNTGLKFKVNLIEKTLLDINAENFKGFNQKLPFWDQFGIETIPTSIEDLKSKLIGNQKFKNFLFKIEKEYNLPDDKYDTLQFSDEFKIINKTLNSKY